MKVLSSTIKQSTNKSSFSLPQRLSSLMDGRREGVFSVCVVVVIDEIENSMHPTLIYQLLKYIFNRESKGQLICTTHLTLLQDQQELLRPDELWKVEKFNGSSEMTSFNDYKIHNTMNIRKGYEEGRYGGVPQISDIE